MKLEALNTRWNRVFCAGILKIEQRILNARSKETNINLIAKLGKIQFLRFVYSAKTGEITTSNVGE